MKPFRLLATLMLSVMLASPSMVRADDATDATLASIEAAVKAGKASLHTTQHWIKLLNEDNTPITVKERVAWGLGLVGQKDKGTVPALLKAAEHKGLLVRSAAVNSLIRLRAQPALPVLEKIARHDPILSVRCNATEGLGLLESTQAIKPLVDLSLDPTPEVKGSAALAMAALQSKKNDFRSALQDMVSDESPFVQERAKDALLIANRKNTDVQALLQSSDRDIRLFAALFFLRYGVKADLKAVQNAYDGESDDGVRKMLTDANIAIKKRAIAKKNTSTTTKSKTAHHKKKKAVSHP
ncbi:MAG: HEAT repeat domain-containing protein [Bdellovibrionales bacterium]|nr:HEAT repeat domain-containing protein [Bdellovibrionales bacterium]